MKKNLETFSKNICSEKNRTILTFFENTYFFKKNNQFFLNSKIRVQKNFDHLKNKYVFFRKKIHIFKKNQKC